MTGSRIYRRVLGPILGGMIVGALGVGCGGSGGGSSIQTPVGGAVSEQTLATTGKRVTLGTLVVLDLEKPGEAVDGDTDEAGQDRIPYRLEAETRLDVELDPTEELYITLISSATGRLVMDVGPDNPTFSADLPAGDYDLYIHSAQTEEASIPVFAQPVRQNGDTRDAFGSWWKVNFGRECKDCDMSGGYYASNNWKGVNIEGANLTAANLTKVNMEGVKAKGAKFTEADLTGAWVRSGDFTSANFEKVKAPEVDFSHTTLTSVNATGANLARAKMEGVVANNATFSKADLTGVFALGANFRGTALRETILTGANLNRAIMESVDAFSAKFMNAQMSGVYGFNGRFDSAVMTGVTAVGSDFSQSKFRGTNLTAADLHTSSFLGTSANEINLSSANLTDVNFGSATMWRATWADAKFIRTRLTDVWADEAKISNGTVFFDADASRISLAKAVVRGVTFERTKLTGIKARGIELEDVSLVDLNAENGNFGLMSATRTKFRNVNAMNAMFRDVFAYGGLTFENCVLWGYGFNEPLTGVTFINSPRL